MKDNSHATDEYSAFYSTPWKLFRGLSYFLENYIAEYGIPQHGINVFIE